MYLYLSLIPQALIASMLPPQEFGSYYAVGRHLHVQGEALFFELDPAFRSDDFPFDEAARKCVPGPAGEPKESVYLAVYRVLSRIPVNALGRLFAVTHDGRTLGLERGDYSGQSGQMLHLYQEFCPITPLVASRLEPLEFCRFITDTRQPIHVPRIVFAELALNGLATDPVGGVADNLPYRYMEHLRDCLGEVHQQRKDSKLVLKQLNEGVPYRVVRGGFYVGDADDFALVIDLDSLEPLAAIRVNAWQQTEQAEITETN